MIRSYILLFLMRFAVAITISESALADDRYFVGLQSIATEYAGETLPIRVFYPTQDAERPENFGPWEVSVAINAAPIEGHHAVVFISHGLGGNKWSHHLLASELARSGLVAVSFDHADDLLRVGHEEHLVLRPLELQSVMSHVLNAKEIPPQLDHERLGVFGYSLGGFTALSAAGAHHKSDRIAKHCDEPKKDPNYCAKPDLSSPLPLHVKLQRLSYKFPKPEETAEETLDFKAIVLAAPLAQPFVDADAVTGDLMLIRASNDQELRYPYHAQYLHEIMKRQHTYVEVPELHHYAFLSPFPDSIQSEVGEAALDPEGFNRREFLDTIHAQIRDFFLEHL